MVLPVGNPPGGPWVLAFSDEFDSGTKPNPAVWSDHLIEGDSLRTNDGGTEMQWYPHDRRGLSVSGSVLSLIARHESPTAADPLCPTPLPGGQTGAYTSGMIQSHPGFQATYGYYEARIQLPAAVAGTWPAWWMYTADDLWPPEIDIQESIDNPSSNATTYHDESGTVFTSGNTAGSWASQWHVYGASWDATGITFYIDGVQFYQVTSGTATITTLPMHLVINLAISTQQDGTGSGYPCSVLIDYVRMWTTSGVPAQPVISSISPADGIPTAGTLTVNFASVSGATSYRATPCPVDNIADTGNIAVSARHPATGSASPLTITGLANGVRYTATVAAINATGYSIESPPVPSLTGAQSYRLYPVTNGPSSSASDPSTQYVFGLSFKVTAPSLYLRGWWWWVADSSQVTAPQDFALWRATGAGTGTYVAGSKVTSGTLSLGWNFIKCASPIPLTSGQEYRAVCSVNKQGLSQNGYSITQNYFNTGAGDAGIQRGPLFAYSGNVGTNDEPLDSAQMCFVGSVTDVTTNYPHTQSNQSNYWLDVQIGTAVPAASGLLLSDLP